MQPYFGQLDSLIISTRVKHRVARKQRCKWLLRYIWNSLPCHSKQTILELRWCSLARWAITTYSLYACYSGVLHANAEAARETPTMLDLLPEAWRPTANKRLQWRGLLVFRPNISPNMTNSCPLPAAASSCPRSARLSSVQHRWSE